MFLLTHSISVAPVDDNGVKEITVYEIVDTLQKEQLRMAPQKDIDSVQTAIRALEKTWFRVIADRSDTTEYLLQKGERIELKADSTLQFLVGNAAGLDFTINHVPTGVLGRSNEIISYMKVTLKGITDKRLKKIKRKERKE